MPQKTKHVSDAEMIVGRCKCNCIVAAHVSTCFGVHAVIMDWLQKGYSVTLLSRVDLSIELKLVPSSCQCTIPF